MPRRTSLQRRAPRRRRMRGSGFLNVLKKIGGFLKKTGLVSSVANALGKAGIPFASDIGKFAGSVGFGRRRAVRGGSLRLAGGRRKCIGYRR